MEVARYLYDILIYLSAKDYKWVICSNHINSFPVTVQDVEFAQKVWDKNIAALKGNNTWKNHNVVARDQVKIPAGLIKLHKEVCFTCNTFLVNEFQFFMMLSQSIYFTAVNHLENRTVLEIFKAFKEVYQYFLYRSFCVTEVHVDGDFGPLKSLIESLPEVPIVNLSAENEHVPGIKSLIRVVKERYRATWHFLPFQKTPKLLIPRNSQAPRTKGTICLGPSENLQEGYKFMALNSGKKIVR